MGNKRSKPEARDINNKIKASLRIEDQIKLFGYITGEDDEKAKEIIKKMKNVNEEIKDIYNLSATVLTLACRFGKIEIVKFVIELGADVNTNDCKNNNNTVLSIAARNGNIKIVELLLNAGADLNHIDKFGNSALSEAVDNNNYEIFELLISSGLVDLEKCGGKAFICASLNNNTRIAERFIELNVNVNFVNPNNGWTSFHYACQYNHFKMVDLLLKNGANENIKITKVKLLLN